MTDEELAKGLGIHNDPRWPAAIAKMDPKKRESYERLLCVSDLLNAGIIPPGMMIDGPRKRRKR